jgi:fatty-acyl-CoA synthase
MPNTKQSDQRENTHERSAPLISDRRRADVALARYPSRTAFSWPGGSMTYRAATDLIGRMQSVFDKLGFAPGTRVALLTANRADAWCAGAAAGLARLATTSLHPLGSLDDQLFQLEDSEAEMLIVDAVTFRDRQRPEDGLYARARGLRRRSLAGGGGGRERNRALPRRAR